MSRMQSPFRKYSFVLVLTCALFFGASAGGEDRKLPESAVVYLDKSLRIDCPWPVKRVSVTNPKVADATVLTPKQVLILGKSVGTTDLILWSAEEKAFQMNVDVKVDVHSLEEDLGELFKDCTLNVTQSRDVVLIRGRLDLAERAAELHRYMEALGLRYVDMTEVAGPQQVMIKVRIAEVSRTAVRALGVNFFGADDDIFGASSVGNINPVSAGPPQGSPASPDLKFEFASDVQVSPGVTLFAGFPSSDIMVFLSALAENQYLRILAEPNLVALSGEEASFLAGGEYPIPIAQGTGGGTAISVEYREFGVRLKFRPIVLGNGSIRIHVSPEASQLSDVGAVDIEGFSIPSVVTRKSETTVEMKSGQTFAMAGLISRSNTGINARVPLLGDLPVLGALFRSVRYRKADTELLVLVTASLVSPTSDPTPGPVPGTLHISPNDWELYVNGQLEGGEPAKLSSVDAAWLKEMGFDRLVGAGGWESYGQEMGRSCSNVKPEAITALSATTSGSESVDTTIAE